MVVQFGSIIVQCVSVVTTIARLTPSSLDNKQPIKDSMFTLKSKTMNDKIIFCLVRKALLPEVLILACSPVI